MARSIKQLEEDLQNLGETVAENSTQLKNLYSRYLECLSESAKKQLILAGYKMCTEIYPQSFLNLSLSQRQTLQQTLRNIGKEIKPLLEKELTSEDLRPEPVDLGLIAQMLKQSQLNKSKNTDSESDDIDRSNSDLTNIQVDELADNVTMITVTDSDNSLSDENEDEPEIIAAESLEQILKQVEQKSQENSDEEESVKEIDFSNPNDLILWQKAMERQIEKTLDVVSKKANKSLQDVEIIPSKFSRKNRKKGFLKGEPSSHKKMKNPANIVNLSIDPDKKKKLPPINLPHISLLRLRLSEIEFIDPILSKQRKEIRDFMKKIKDLQRLYTDKVRECTMAQADSAWRSSWYED